jgi:conjugal transfer pilus assembly protein TraL
VLDLEMPHRIDDPPMFLLWSLYDMIGFILIVLLGIATSQLLVSILLGLVLMRLYRRHRERRPEGYILHWLYWYGLIPVTARSIPNPFCRRWVP